MNKKVEIRQVRISKSLDHCAKCWGGRKCKVSNDEFPGLSRCLRAGEDCSDFFVEPGGRFWYPEDFFNTYPQNITRFWVLEEELNEETDEDSPAVACGVVSEPRNRHVLKIDPTFYDSPEPGNLFPRKK